MQEQTMIGVEAGPASNEPDTTPQPTLQDALALALRMHQSGHLEVAEKLYRSILELSPGHPDALHFLGVLEHQGGHSEAAIELIRRAISALPGEPGPWNNLGNVLVEAGRLDEAMQAYTSCLELAPDFADAHNNLGTIHRLRGDFRQAEASYRRAIAVQPEVAETWNNLAKLMVAQRRIREAVGFACKAITLLPHDPDARKLLGVAYYTLGEIDKAGEVYREWLGDEPDNPIALHHLAACTGQAVPARASDAYVARTFDAFADSFDAKLQMLSYRAPQLVATALNATCGEPAGALAVLDAGCGTGLCGPLLRAHARLLVGVDLSGRMLERARQRGLYDQLEQAELAAFLMAQPGAFDVVVSADTLCYFGELDGVARAARCALRDQGLLLFTVEALAEGVGAPFRLNAHGRYAHARAYVEACLDAAGLQVLAITMQVLRREGGVSVEGWLVSAHKPATDKSLAGAPNQRSN